MKLLNQHNVNNHENKSDGGEFLAVNLQLSFSMIVLLT